MASGFAVGTRPGALERLRNLVVEAVPFLMLAPALAIPLALTAAIGVSPLSAIDVLIEGAAGGANSLGVTVAKLSPLLITGLGIAVGIRCGLWNLGGEGQIYLGGLGATVVVLYVVPFAPGAFQIAAAILGGAVGGAVWILIPALLRAYRGVNELITTLLLNFVAINLVTMLVQGPLGEKGASYPRSPSIPDSAQLPVLIERTQMHSGVLVGLVLTAVVYVLLWHTEFGLELRAAGRSERAARFTGVDVRARMVQALLVSGALAGIAGAIEILGLHHRLPRGFSPGYGFEAIAVALLGGMNALGIVFSALFFAMLRAGAPAMKRSLGVPSDLVILTQGLVILAVVAGYGLRAFLKRRMKFSVSNATTEGSPGNAAD